MPHFVYILKSLKDIKGWKGGNAFKKLIGL
jgi:hypothetical protein